MSVTEKNSHSLIAVMLCLAFLFVTLAAVRSLRSRADTVGTSVQIIDSSASTTPYGYTTSSTQTTEISLIHPFSYGTYSAPAPTPSLTGTLITSNGTSYTVIWNPSPVPTQYQTQPISPPQQPFIPPYVQESLPSQPTPIQRAQQHLPVSQIKKASIPPLVFATRSPLVIRKKHLLFNYKFSKTGREKNTRYIFVHRLETRSGKVLASKTIKRSLHNSNNTVVYYNMKFTKKIKSGWYVAQVRVLDSATLSLVAKQAIDVIYIDGS